MTRAQRHPYPTPTMTGRGAITESALGVDRVDIGVLAGTPRIIFEDAGFTIWEIDNSAGTLRFFTPGSLKMTLNSAGLLSVTGGVDVSGLLRSLGAGAGVVIQNQTGAQLWQWYVNANIARLSSGAGDVLTVDSAGNVVATGTISGTAVYGRAHATAVQAIANDTVVRVVLGSATSNGVTFNNASDQLEVVTAGRYLIQGRVKLETATVPTRLGPTTSGRFTLHAVKNESTTPVELDDDHDVFDHAEEYSLQVATTVPLIAGDNICLTVYHTHGLSQNLHNGFATVWLSIDRLGA